MKTKILITLVILIGLVAGGFLVYQNLILPEKLILPGEEVKVEEEKISPEIETIERVSKEEASPISPPPEQLPPIPVEKYIPGLIGEFSCQGKSAEIEIGELRTKKIVAEDDFTINIDGTASSCNLFLEDVGPLHAGRCIIKLIEPEQLRKFTIIAKEESSYSVSFTCLGIEFEPRTAREAEAVYNLSDFEVWAAEREIALVGIVKDANEVYYQGLKEDDIIALKDVSLWWIVEKALKKIPDNVLQLMGKSTIYFSNKSGRGYAMSAAFLEGTTAGFILEQPITEDQVIHEFGHILDGVIKNTADYKSQELAKLDQERKRLFEVADPYDPSRPEPPAGFISIYASANDQENIAEHFSYYILYPAEFRQKAEADPLLKEKYEFLKMGIFQGKEY